MKKAKSSNKKRAAVLVSACLLGRRVRYDGGHSATDDAILASWRQQGRIISFCPEVGGGLPTPRPPAEIVGGEGKDVLEGGAQVVTEEGVEVTDAFLRGAWAALEAALEAGAEVAVLKSKSPSCGSKAIYDGSFSGARISGQGVTAALLSRHGIAVFNEGELAEADAWLRRLESGRA